MDVGRFLRGIGTSWKRSRPSRIASLEIVAKTHTKWFHSITLDHFVPQTHLLDRLLAVEDESRPGEFLFAGLGDLPQALEDQLQLMRGMIIVEEMEV